MKKTTEDLAPLEIELLEMMLGQRTKHDDGTDMVWGAWMGACLEFLEDDDYVELVDGVYRVTEAGKAALLHAQAMKN